MTSYFLTQRPKAACRRRKSFVFGDTMTGRRRTPETPRFGNLLRTPVSPALTGRMPENEEFIGQANDRQFAEGEVSCWNLLTSEFQTMRRLVVGRTSGIHTAGWRMNTEATLIGIRRSDPNCTEV